MPTLSTVTQGGAQRSEQYLEARTGRGARAAGPPAGVGAKMRQPTGDRLRTPRNRERRNERELPQASAAIERFCSGRCGVSPLELGGRDGDSTAVKVLSPVAESNRLFRNLGNETPSSTSESRSVG